MAKCPKCGKPQKEDTDGDERYCQGHSPFDKSNDRAFHTGWSVVKGMFENPGGFGADECNICGKKGGEENPLYESKQGNSYCKGCYSQRGRIE